MIILPALTFFCMLLGACSRISVYDAFVRGAGEGLRTLVQMFPALAAIFTASALLRSSGLINALEELLAPAARLLGLPESLTGLVLLRPLSGSASLALVSDILREAGPDSREALLACVICGASDTVFFTGSLYLGAAGVERARGFLPIALASYLAGVLFAAQIG